jgi:hypothetical protein
MVVPKGSWPSTSAKRAVNQAERMPPANFVRGLFVSCADTDDAVPYLDTS